MSLDHTQSHGDRDGSAATIAVRPAELSHSFFALGVRSVELERLGPGKPLLEMDGAASNEQDGRQVPHWGNAGWLAEPAA